MNDVYLRKLLQRKPVAPPITDPRYEAYVAAWITRLFGQERT